MHFSLNTNMYRVSKPFLFYKHTFDKNEDVYIIELFMILLNCFM